MADWDGSTGTDDTAAVQAALDAVSPESGGTVDLGLGRYRIDAGPLRLKPGTRLVAGGHVGAYEASSDVRSGALVLTGGGTLIDIDGGDTVIQTGASVEGVVLHDTTGQGTLLHVRAANRVHLQRVTFQGAAVGIHAESGLPELAGGDCSWHTFDSCVFHDCGVGIVGDGGPAGLVLGGDMTACGVGIDVTGRTAAMRVVGMKFDGGIGIRTKGYSNHVIGCDFEGCTTGIVADGDPDLYPAPPAGEGLTVLDCGFVGSDGTEAGIEVTADARWTTIGPCRFSNLASNVTDAGIESRFTVPTTGRFGSPAAGLVVGNMGTPDTAFVVADGTAANIATWVASKGAGPIYLVVAGTAVATVTADGLTVAGKRLVFDPDGTVGWTAA